MCHDVSDEFSIMECIKCGRKSIKYRCIGCKSPICNVCSVSCSDETPGYCEETYLVGKCEECHGSNCRRKVSETLTLSKPRQSSLSSFLKRKTIRPSTLVETPKKSKHQDDNSDSITSATSTEKSPETPTATAPSAKKSRNLSVVAANRWVTTNLAAHLASEWLVINANGGHVASLNCSVCKTYADKVRGMKNFSNAWAFHGSTNLRLSNAEDHARGEPHKKALDLHLKGEKGQCAMERAECMRTFNQAGQQLITTGIVNMQASDLANTKIKFDVAYFIAKEELPLSKFPKLLQLEERHGVTIGTAYRNDMSCSTFIAHIGEETERNLREQLSSVKFFSVLTDGSEDASVSEMEAVFVQYLETNPPGRDTIQVATSFLR